MLTGRGSCESEYDPSETKNYCASSKNCNNFALIGFTCFNPSTLANVSCDSSHWQCTTSNTNGVGSCGGQVDSSAFFTCATGVNCNTINSCLKAGSTTNESITCDSAKTKACQVKFVLSHFYLITQMNLSLFFSTQNNAPSPMIVFLRDF